MENSDNTENHSAALTILHRWQCSTEEIEALIGSDPCSIKSNLILDIDHALRCTFSNEANINGFAKMKNRNGKFYGLSPMELMIHEGVDGMIYTLKTIRRMTHW